MRTEEEIKKQLEAGKKFTERHPRSVFGTDNTKHFKIFMKIIEKAKRGESARMLEEFINDAYLDDEDNSFAYDVICWLFYNEDPCYDEEIYE